MTHERFTDLLSDVPEDSLFVDDAEEFGGALDLRRTGTTASLEAQAVDSRELTRVLFLPPLQMTRFCLAAMTTSKSSGASLLQQTHLGILLSETPNAYAWRVGDHYNIALTAGLGHLLFGWTAHLLSFRSFLPNLLEGAEEEADGNLEELRADFSLARVADFHSLQGKVIATHRLPRSQVRMDLTYAITHVALSFALLHELGHIAAGHVDFAVLRLAMPSIEELRTTKTALGADLQLAQTFELMADNFAIEASLLARLAERYGASATDGHAIWTIASDLLLWLFSYRSRRVQPSESHPHPQVRILNKLAKVAQFRELNPHYVNCVLPSGTAVDIATLSHRISAQVGDAWTTLGLPGHELRSIVADGVDRRSINAFRDVVAEKSSLVRDFEASLDVSAVSALLAPLRYLK